MENEKKFLRSADYDDILKSIIQEYENPFGLFKAIFQNQREINPDFIKLMTNAIDKGQNVVITRYLDIEPFDALYQSTGYKFYESLKKYLLELEESLKESIQNEDENKPIISTLDPIEKLLVAHYLDIAKPNYTNYKDGINFYSRLFGINPNSLKNNMNRIANYTTDDDKPLTLQSCTQRLIPLKKVKKFFDDSGMKKESKLVDDRINHLILRSGV